MRLYLFASIVKKAEARSRMKLFPVRCVNRSDPIFMSLCLRVPLLRGLFMNRIIFSSRKCDLF